MKSVTKQPRQTITQTLRLLIVGVVAAGLAAGCTTPRGGEVTWASEKENQVRTQEAGTVEGGGGVDILTYRPPGSQVPEGVRSAPAPAPNAKPAR